MRLQRQLSVSKITKLPSSICSGLGIGDWISMRGATFIIIAFNDDDTVEVKEMDSFDWFQHYMDEALELLDKKKFDMAGGKEQFEEAETLSKDIGLAGEARSVEQERKSLLSFLGAGLGLAFGGPLPMLLGFAGGKALGGLGTYGGKADEDYMVSEDVGTFGKSEQFERQDINKELRAADKADFWGDIMDNG